MSKNYHENIGFEKENLSENDTPETESEEQRRIAGSVVIANLGANEVLEYVMYKRRWFGMFAIFMLNLSTGLVWLTFNAVPDISAEWLHTGKSHVNLSVSIAIFIVNKIATKVLGLKD